MADPRAFISFDADNNFTEKTLFAGQTYLSIIPFSIQDWSSKEPLPQAEWEALIKAKIAKTNMLIVLCGKSMSTATGVVKEINMANSQNVPIFGVYVDGAGTSSTLPTGLPRSRVVEWNWAKISSAITQVMGEGKNKSS
jgi:hypothetical protein